MGNEVKEYEDQATELRKLFNEVQQGELTTEHKDSNTDEPENKLDDARAIDILNLPPRKEVHRNKSGRTHFKMKRPLMRFVFVILILLGVLFGLYYVWGVELLEFL